MTRRALHAAIVVTCALTAYLVVYSNFYDWDAFYALNEVDRRSWLEDFEAPLWTYQLCGGMSRIADPQAFGLSPLFVVVLAFGSVWGSKLWVLLSLALGAFFAARIFERFHAPASGAGEQRSAYVVLGMLFVLGNYFVWHLLVGHLTFSVVLLGLGIVHYTLEGYLKGLSWRQFALGSVLAWQHYSGAFFHSVVFFLAPFFLAFGLFVGCERLVARLRGEALGRPLQRCLAAAAGFHLCGIALASYKLWAVWDYSRDTSRMLRNWPEQLSPLQIAGHLLVPTLDHAWIVPFSAGTRWTVIEYSAFSLITPLLGVAAVAALWRRAPGGRTPGEVRWRLPLLASIYLAVAASFSLGDFAAFAPFPLVDRLLFGGEGRVVARFHIGIVLAEAMLLMVLLRPALRRSWMAPRVCLVLLLAQCVNLGSFLGLTSAGRLQEVLTYPSEPGARMRGWQRITLWVPYGNPPAQASKLLPGTRTDMYRYVLLGEGVVNCYNALPLPRGSAPYIPIAPLVAADIGNPGDACLEQSYFTQNRIVLDESCPELVCVNADRINPRQHELHLAISSEHRRWCRDRPPADPMLP